MAFPSPRVRILAEHPTRSRLPRLAWLWLFGFVLLVGACGGGGSESVTPPPGCTPADGDTITVIGLDTLKFDSKCYTAPGNEITFDYLLSPESNQIHDLRIENEPGLFLELDALKREATGLALLKPGRYDLFCSISGHREAGMEADLFIS